MNESLHTIFLAQAMGLYLTFMSIIMLARANYYRALLENIKVGSSGVVVAASFGLILGIVLVLIHNIWMFKPLVLVTIVAWGLLVKSILWLAYPECMIHMAQKLYSGWGYYLVVIVTGIIGVVLLSHGYCFYR